MTRTGRRSEASTPIDPALVARARNGSRIARRRLRRHTRAAVYPFALSLTGRPVPAARAVRLALDDALATPGQDYTSAVVSAIHTRAFALTPDSADDEGRRSRAALALCDRGGLSQAAAARLLGLTRKQLADSHARGRADLGVAAAPDRCRGWSLVSRDASPLTVEEQQARESHLSRCRACTQGLRSRALVRRHNKVGAIGAVGTAAAFAGNAVLTAAAPTIAAGAIGVAVAGGLGLQTISRMPASTGGAPAPAVSVDPSPRGSDAPTPSARVSTPLELTQSPEPDASPEPQPNPAPRVNEPSPDPIEQPTPSPSGQPLLPDLPLPSLPTLPLSSLPPLPPVPAVRLSLPPLPVPTTPLSFPVTPEY